MLISNEGECIQNKLKNVNINDSQEHAKWYTYWEKNGEEFVNETWIKQYGSYITDDLPMDSEELYKKHREEQYQILYWKFINETASIETEEHNNL